MRDQPKWEGKQACPECGRVTYSFLHSCPGVPQRPPRHSVPSESDAEEAEYHIEQLREARDSAERRAERIEARAVELATERDAALVRIARAERLIDSWEHDAPDHSNPVFIGRLRECLRRDPVPIRLRGDECNHQWLDRPESDSRECLICGTEADG